MLRKYSLFFLLVCLTACRFNDHKMQEMYADVEFDKGVVQRLPLYDSLVSTITDSIHLFRKETKQDETYQAYTYSVLDTQPEGYPVLPPAVDAKIRDIFTRAGADYLFGFDVFKDSTIKIRIRSYRADAGVDRTENLSYYPHSKPVVKNEFPTRDTLLSDHWRYWIRLNKRVF